jgi:membrane protein
MRPPPSAPEGPADKLVAEGRADLEGAEERAEATADEALQRHPHLSPFLRVGGAVLREQGVETVGLAAAGATFWLTIAAFPTAIAAVSLFGLVVSPEKVATDLGNLASGAPASLGSLVTTQLRRVAASDHARLSLGLATSLLVALWSASAGVYNLDRAIRVAYGLAPQRYAEARGRALVGAVAVVVLLGIAALAISAAVGRSRAPLVVVIAVPTLLVAVVAGIAGLYRFSIGSGVRPRALLPGAMASSVGVVGVLAGFGAYVAVSSHYTAVYGVFAGAVIGMFGTYLAVYVVLLGAVLNAQLALLSGRSVGGLGASGGDPSKRPDEPAQAN